MFYLPFFMSVFHGCLTTETFVFFSIFPANDILFEDDEGTRQSSMDLLFGSTKLYIVVGCVAALVALALLQASCTLYRATRKRTTKVNDS